jgi:hypothetical protein
MTSIHFTLDVLPISSRNDWPHAPRRFCTDPGGQTQVVPVAFRTIGGRQSIGRLGAI